MKWLSLASLGICLCIVVSARGAPSRGIQVAGHSADQATGMIAYMLSKEGAHKLVVVDNDANQRYEKTLESNAYAPFWFGGTIFVIQPTGILRTFTLKQGFGLAQDQKEVASSFAIRAIEFSTVHGILFWIETRFDIGMNKLGYSLVAYNLKQRVPLWSRTVREPGFLKCSGQKIFILGDTQVQEFSLAGEVTGTIVRPTQRTESR